MRTRLGWFAGSALVAAGLLVALTSVGAQQAPAYRAPRASDGHPNLNGIWQAMNTANWDIEAHPAGFSPVRDLGAAGAVPGGLGVVEGGALPYKPDALAKKKENYANRLKLDPEIRCYLPGVPRAIYQPFPFQIIQSTKHIMMLHEYAGAVRTIYMAEQVEAPADSWMGWSNGKWDGDTLVIEVNGFNDQTWFDRAGNHHTEGLKVTERYSMNGDNVLNYEARIEDPKTFSRPWTIRMPLYRRLEPNVQLLEFKCVEFSEELLYGDLKKK